MSLIRPKRGGTNFAKVKRESEAKSAADEARVAVDDLISGRNHVDFVGERPRLLKLALQKYRIEHPGKAPIRPVIVATRSLTASQASAMGRWRAKDIYCLFCGEMVGHHERDIADRHIEKALPCALMFLAGMIKAVAPGTRKPPTAALSFDFETDEQPGLFGIAKTGSP